MGERTGEVVANLELLRQLDLAERHRQQPERARELRGRVDENAHGCIKVVDGSPHRAEAAFYGFKARVARDGAGAHHTAVAGLVRRFAFRERFAQQGLIGNDAP